MVDKTSDIGNIIIFPLRRTGGVLSIVKSNAISSIDSSNSQDLAQIAQAIFIRMTKAAEALVKDDSSANFKKLKEEADFLLTMEMALGDKMLIFKDLDLLCKQQKQSSIQAQAADSQQANSYVSNQLKILLEILQTSLRISSLDDWGDGDDNDLRALHAVPRNMEQPAWSRELFSILTKTTVPESGRIMVYDNLAGFYDLHLNMFKMNKKQEPYWDIAETATFVLDIADEEFRQEEEYDQKIEQPPEEKYNTDFGITLRTDFKKNFLEWVETNLQDFQEAGLGRSPLKIFNELCVSAKKGQALRLALG
ncbi:MAG: hypothetical protein ACOYK1_04955 [Vampirovibrionia bacterium]